MAPLASLCVKMPGPSKKKLARAPVPTEAHEQAMLAAILNRLRLTWLHVPNEGLHHISYRVKMRRAGLSAGAPDVLIFTPPPAQPRSVGCAIELKRQRGGVVSDAQEAWLARLTMVGWATKVCRGCHDAVSYLQEMGYC